MIFLFENFAESRLVSGITQDATVLLLPPSDAARWPKPTLDSHRASVVLFDGQQEPEIVWITSNPGTGEVTVERGMEGTAAQIWRAGTAAINTPTKVSLNYLASGGADSWHQELLDMVNEAYARITVTNQLILDGDSALAERIETVEAGWEQQAAKVQVIQQAYADINQAWALYQEEVSAQAADAVAKATQSMNVTAGFGQAIATLRTDLETAVGDNFAGFAEKIEAFTNFDEAQVAINTNIEARVGSTEAGLSEEILLRTTQYEAQVLINQDIETRVGQNTAGLSTEITVRSGETSALATRATNLEAEVGAARGGQPNLSARITEVESVAAGQTSAVASRTTSLEARMATAEGDITTIEGDVTQTNARIGTEEIARADGDSALATRATNLEARATSVEGRAGALEGRATSVESRATSLESATADLAAGKADASRVTALESQVQAAGTGLLARMTTVESTTASLQAGKADASRATALEARATTLEGDVDALEGRAGSLEGRATTVEARTTSLESVTADLQAGKADASRATALEARALALENRSVSKQNLLYNPTGLRGLDGWTNNNPKQWVAGDWSWGRYFSLSLYPGEATTAYMLSDPQLCIPSNWYTLSGSGYRPTLTGGVISAGVQWYSDTAGQNLIDWAPLYLDIPLGSFAPAPPISVVSPANAQSFRIGIYADSATHSYDTTVYAGIGLLKFEQGDKATPFTDDRTTRALSEEIVAAEARLGTVEQAAVDLAAGKADASRVSVVEAKIATRSFYSTNADFSDWPATSSLPNGWTNYGVAVPQKVGVGGVSPWAVRFDTTGGHTTAGLSQYIWGLTKGFHVVVVEATLEAGSFTGVGFLFRPIDASWTVIGYPGEVHLGAVADDNDPTGTPVGDGVVGRTYRFSILVDASGPEYNSMVGALLYVMVDDYFNSNAKKVLLRFAGTRPATASEVELRKARGGSASLSARLLAEENARVTGDTAEASARQLVEARATSLENRINRGGTNRLRNPSGREGFAGWTQNLYSYTNDPTWGWWFRRYFTGATGEYGYMRSDPILGGNGYNYTLSGRGYLTGLTDGFCQLGVYGYTDTEGTQGERLLGHYYWIAGQNVDPFQPLPPMTFATQAEVHSMRVWSQSQPHNNTAYGDFGFWQLKLEQGDVATPFTDDQSMAAGAQRALDLEARTTSAESAIVNLQTGKAEASALTATNAAVGNLEAATGILQTSVADHSAKFAEGRLAFSATSPGGTPVLTILSDTYGNSIRLAASEIHMGDDTIFDDATNTERTTGNGLLTITAKGASFGTDGTLRQWIGPSSVSFAAASRSNAYFYVAHSPPHLGGSGFPGSQGNGAKALTGATGNLAATAVAGSVIADSLITIDADFNAPQLTSGSDLIGNIVFEENDGGGWVQLGATSVVIPWDGTELGGVYGGGNASATLKAFGTLDGQVTYRARFERTAGSALYGNQYQMSGTLQILPPLQA